MNRRVGRGAAWALGVLACLYYLPRTPAEPEPDRLQVAAAISLREVLEVIAADFEKASGVTVGLTFGSSGQLMAQIRHGAPVDVFISAAHDQVDALEQEGYLVPDSSRVIAGNRLVLIVPKSANPAPTSFQDLANPEFRRVAIGDPGTVPAGAYARQVLGYLGLNERLKDRLVYGANVRQVLEYVARGEVSAGLVYSTDVRLEGGLVSVVATADGQWHRPIEYPAAILKSARHRQVAHQFLAYLAGEDAVDRLRAGGFEVPDSLAELNPLGGAEQFDQTSVVLSPGSGT